MSSSMHRNLLIASTAVALSACGGGGSGGGPNFTPPPPEPTPITPSTDPIIGQAEDTQQFAAFGGSVDIPADLNGPASVDADAPLDVRFDAATGTYDVRVPGEAAWSTLGRLPDYTPPAGEPYLNFVTRPTNGSTEVFLSLQVSEQSSDPALQYSYSNLAHWSAGLLAGSTAFGIPTAAGAVPTTGSATYSGLILGDSGEIVDLGEWGPAQGTFSGDINLAFDFGAGTLSGAMHPKLYLDQEYDLGTFAFTNTVYSAGSTSFSGSFGTSVGGINSFAGAFAGPQAQELIGRWALPYLSPVDGSAQQGVGAFVAKKP